MAIDENGTSFLKNDFINMDASSVFTLTTKKNQYFKGVQKRAAAFMLSQLPPDESNAALRIILTNTVMSNMEEIPDEIQERIKEFMTLNLKLEENKLLLQNFQMEQQIDQIMNQAMDPNSVTPEEFQNKQMQNELSFMGPDQAQKPQQA